MSNSRLLLIDHLQSPHRVPSMATDTNMRPDSLKSRSSLPCQSHSGLNNEVLEISALPCVHVLPDHGPSRSIREREERTTVEDKIRRAVESWTAEERATAYWYLYACGMTLEKAKAIRHKGGFTT